MHAPACLALTLLATTLLAPTLPRDAARAQDPRAPAAGAGAVAVALPAWAPAADAYLRGEADSGFAGVVLVATGGRVVLHRAYGPPGARRDTTTAFWIASNSKQFTAAAVLALQAQGRLSVRDSLARFFPDAPAAWRGVTIHQLLTHSAGFGRHDAAWGVTDRSAAVRALLATTPAYPAGRDYLYTNDDYALLAALVEVASGRPFETYLRETLLRPAGMRHSGFWGEGRDAEVAPPQAAALAQAASVPATTWRAGRSRANWGDRGSTGLFSTASDLFHWVRALQSGRVLPDSAVHELFAPQVFVRREGDTDVYYGYGWGVERTGRTLLLRHFGDEWMGHNSAMRLADRGLTIIVLSNAGHAGGAGAPTWSARVSRGLQRLVEEAAR